MAARRLCNREHGVNMTVEALSSKIKPGVVVVTLKSSVQGDESSQNWQEAKRLRGRIVSYVWNKCVYTEYGLLCPDDATSLLDVAISKAKLEADLFNNKFEDVQVVLRVMRSRLEPDAAELIAEEVFDAETALDNAVISRDVHLMRKSADKVAALVAFLRDEAREEIVLKIQEARKTATATAAAAREPEKVAARELKKAEKERKKTEKERVKAEKEDAKRAKKNGGAFDAICTTGSGLRSRRWQWKRIRRAFLCAVMRTARNGCSMKSLSRRKTRYKMCGVWCTICVRPRLMNWVWLAR